ncbi:YtxH domain-containing protein [Hathewaya limosa]|uniref:Gas vesicle protein n=1 Tax=Hathewaya limosa TaxID=1536 RepID=A0ABU0JN18_HATLI|nr:YtxH domain-containing protein [Hathewaya limosa]AWZ49238.1 hypothetical protein C3495_10615 [Clostridiaceae bacterium 14S0207]MDQ0478473.1 gas vesicle protein [Hathewaya limosa]
MGAKFAKGITAGALIGMAAGMMMVPSMDRQTKRKIRRANRVVKSYGGDMINSMRDMMMDK